MDKESCEVFVGALLREMGLDMSNEHLKDTPKRVVMMYGELFSGLDKTNEPIFTTFDNPNYDEMIIVKGNFSSTCSHHLLPFIGQFYFAYIANEKLCGLSKIPRVVEYFSKRPQLQERLTQQIVDYLNDKLQPKGCMLIMKAKHYCEILRGVKQHEDTAETITSAIKGIFMKQKVKEEFIQLIKT